MTFSLPSGAGRGLLIDNFYFLISGAGSRTSGMNISVLVIPAKAGIHSVNSLDSRLRGNDGIV